MQSGENDEYPEEPDFGPPADAAAEQATLDAIERRNRLRVLIPLALLISLIFALSFFDDPLKPDASDTPNKPQPTAPAPVTP